MNIEIHLMIAIYRSSYGKRCFCFSLVAVK
jgi:hypothetical protein